MLYKVGDCWQRCPVVVCSQRCWRSILSPIWNGTRTSPQLSIMLSAASATSHQSSEPSSLTPGSENLGTNSRLKPFVVCVGCEFFFVCFFAFFCVCQSFSHATFFGVVVKPLWPHGNPEALESALNDSLLSWQDHHLPVHCLCDRPCGQVSGSHSHCGKHRCAHVSSAERIHLSREA